MDHDPEPDHEFDALSRKLTLANLRLQYAALVAQCTDLDSTDTIRQLNIKHVVHQDTLLTTQLTQSTQTAELLRDALDRIAFLESTSDQGSTDSQRLSTELGTANELVKKLEGKVKELEKELRDSERALKGEREKVKCQAEKGGKLEEDLREEQQRLKDAQEQLGEVNGKLRDANEQVKEQETELGKVKYVGGKEGKELVELREENGSLKSELGKLKREKQRLQSENTSLCDVSTKANNLLADKIALSHQVSHLNTELDSLRSISETSKTHLAEKLDLKQRLTTMEFELANCKNIITRLKENISTLSTTESQLRKELAEAKTTIGKEIKAREKVEQEGAKAKEEWEAREKSLKAKVENGRKAIRELKEAGEQKGGGKRKAGAAQLTMEDLEATVKKPRIKGPKPSVSEFSMTPFLKKVGQAPAFMKGKKAPGDETVVEGDSSGEVEDEIEQVENDVEMAEEVEALQKGEGHVEDAMPEIVEEAEKVKPQPKTKQTQRKKAPGTTTDPLNNDTNYTPTSAPDPAAPSKKKKRLTAKEKKSAAAAETATAAAASLMPVAILTSQPTKLLLASANNKKQPHPPSSSAACELKKGRVPSTSRTTAASAHSLTTNGPANTTANSSTILDEAFEEHLEDVIGGVKSVPLTSALPPPLSPPPPPPASPPPPNPRVNAGGKGKKQGTLKLARSLFEDADGTGSLDFDLERVPVLGVGGAGAAGEVLRREISPKKKRPKGVGVRVGVGKRAVKL